MINNKNKRKKLL